ncbi:MAG: glycosyltransferase family 2 protein, partial [Candidatus Coprenecus sp.]
NYGFTGGYNRALATLDGEFDYYLLLNSDIEVTPGWLAPLVEFMDSHPECGACAPKIRSWHERESFEHAGAAGGYLDRFFFPYCRGRIMDYVEKDRGQYDDPASCFWVSGAAFMVRSSLWRRLGGLDESFFAHMEEIDFCWRAQLQGWQVWSIPSSVIYHVGGGTLPNNSPRKIYLNFRNNLLMMYKNLPTKWRGPLIFERMLIDGVLATIYLVTGKREFFKMVIRAHSDFRKMKKNCVASEGTVNLKRPHGILFIRRFRIFVEN